MTTRTVTTTREYDDKGRVVKETVVETSTPVYVQPYTVTWPTPTTPGIWYGSAQGTFTSTTADALTKPEEV